MIIETLNQVDASPQFRLWASATLSPERMELITQALEKAGVASNSEQALAYLARSINTGSPKLLALSDFGQDSHHRPWRQLSKMMAGEDEETRLGNLPRIHGIIGHEAIPRLYEGRLPNQAEEDLYGWPFCDNWGDYFWDFKPSQLSFFTDNNPKPKTVVRRLGRGYLSDLDLMVKKLEQYTENSSSWEEAYTLGRDETKELYKLVLPVFGQYAIQINGHQAVGERFLSMPTFMSWARAVQDCQNQDRRVLFKEIRVLDPSFGISGGRVDALEVVSIDGKPVTSKQQNLLVSMSEGRYRSIADLKRNLTAVFGPRVDIKPIDWKFSVGDGVPHNSVIGKEQLSDGPISQHWDQLTRYLTLGALDLSLTGQADGQVWPAKGHFSQGDLVYFLPGETVSQTVSMGPEDREHFFRSKVAAKYNNAQRRAMIREIDNRVLRALREALLGIGVSLSVGVDGGKFWQMPIPGLEGVSIKELVEAHRQFVDEEQIVEQVGVNKNGRPILTLYYDKLLVSLEKGTVEGDLFDPEKGGFISCFMPDHKHTGKGTPSLHIYLEQSTFKCFACGAWGLIDRASMPEGLEIEFKPRTRLQRDNSETAKFLLPEDLAKVMSAAQEILHQSFKGSLGERYLTQVRALDGDLAYQYGVGYGTTGLVNSLIDRGFSFDQLADFGLIGFSPRIPLDRGLSPLLLKRGFSLTDIQRGVRVKGQKEKVPGLPYLHLERRVTFPLRLGGVDTNIYGRAVVESLRAHHKLKTNIPHGAFNIEALAGQTDGVVVAEGAIDALSLIQMGYPNTLAIIGVDNIVILEELVRSGKNLNIALDRDVTGREVTARLQRKLTEGLGFQGKVVDFTTIFELENTDFRGDSEEEEAQLKDFNALLVKRSRNTA